MKTLKKITNKNLMNKMLSALLFAMLFVIVGTAIPDTYYKYIDKKEYLTVMYPMGTDKTSYKPCEDLLLISTYTALQDIHAISFNNWMKINDDGSFTKILDRTKANVFLKAEGQPFSEQLDIPCDLKTGTYFLSGIKSYDVFENQHNYPFVSVPFNIEE